MLRNDPDRRWVNGSVALISRIEGKRVFIRLEGKEHEIEPVAWEHRRYAFDQASEKIVETVAATVADRTISIPQIVVLPKKQVTFTFATPLAALPPDMPPIVMVR